MAISSIQGLGTGIDWANLTEQLIAYESRPLTLIRQRMTEAKADEKAYGDLKSLLTKLRNANDSFRFGTNNAFESRVVTVGETGTGVTGLSATASNAATAGTYTVSVTRLATQQVMASDSYADATAAMNLTGDFSVDGATINVTAGMSLNDIRDAVNTSGANVTATVLNVSGSYSLGIKANDAGAGMVGYVDGTNNVGTSLNLQETQAGQTSQVVVDGIASTSNSNSVEVIPGVQMQLLDVTGASTFQVTVGATAESAADAMEKYVTAYNAAIDFMNAQSTFSDGKSTPALYNDKTLLRIGSRGMRSALGSDLASVGIEVERGGKLKFDRASFESSYNTDAAALQTSMQTIATSMESALTSFAFNGDSTIGSAITNTQRRIDRFEAQEDRWESRMEVRRSTLLSNFNATESLLQSLQGQLDQITRATGQLS